MLYSDCAIFDKNSNNTKILANEAYFENLISFYENDLSTLDLLHLEEDFFIKNLKYFLNAYFMLMFYCNLLMKKEFLDFTTQKTLQNTKDIDYINFEKDCSQYTTRPCLIERIFTGYFVYSKKVFDENSLGEMFKNIIIYRDQKKKWKFINYGKKLF